MQVGGAYTANPKSNSAVYWNPASLANLSQSQVFTGYSRYINEVNEVSFVYNFRFNKNIGFGLGYLGQQVSGIEHTGGSGQSLGSDFDFRSEVALLGLGYRLNDANTVGLLYKFYNQRALVQRSYQSLDLAYSLKMSPNDRFGVVAENVFNHNGKNELSPKYRLGFDKQVEDWTVSIDGSHDTLFRQTYWNYGLAYRGLSPLEIKGGINGYSGTYCLGVSLVFDGMALDYMFSDSSLGALHRIGIVLNLGKDN